MIKKSEFIWNAIASVCASLLSVVLLLIITRVNGVEEAGMFSIAFSSAAILYTIADSQVRVLQVTDATRKYSFGVYKTVRWILSVLMVIVALGFVFLSGYEKEKALICMGIVLFRMIDALSETYQGEFQLNGRLDIAGKSVTYRMIVSILIFAVADALSGNLLLSIGIMFLVNLILWILYDVRKIRAYAKDGCSKEWSEVKAVFIASLPLFVSMFLNNYIINAPKYAIDRYMSYDMQTYFNIIYLPTFVINLMSIFVLKPMLKTLGDMWAEHKQKEFLRILGKMLGAIVVLTVLAEAVGYFLGIPVLAFVYGVNLDAFKADLMILIVAGGFSAATVALLYGLSTMRCQGKSSIAYVAAAAAGLVIPHFLVKKWGITGASISSVLIMAILLLGLAVIFFCEMHRIKKEICNSFH